jgi:hypothetical protein
MRPRWFFDLLRRTRPLPVFARSRRWRLLLALEPRARANRGGSGPTRADRVWQAWCGWAWPLRGLDRALRAHLAQLGTWSGRGLA